MSDAGLQSASFSLEIQSWVLLLFLSARCSVNIFCGSRSLTSAERPNVYNFFSCEKMSFRKSVNSEKYLSTDISVKSEKSKFAKAHFPKSNLLDFSFLFTTYHNMLTLRLTKYSGSGALFTKRTFVLQSRNSAVLFIKLH